MSAPVWLINVADYFAPVDFDRPLAVRGNGGYYVDMLKCWNAVVGDVRVDDEHGDYEDFWEQVARLHAGLRGLHAADRDAEIWVVVHRQRLREIDETADIITRVTAVVEADRSRDEDNTVLRIEFDDEDMPHIAERRDLDEFIAGTPDLLHYGSQPGRRHGPAVNSLPSEERVSDYWRMKAFTENAGRAVTVCAVPDDDADDSSEATAARAITDPELHAEIGKLIDAGHRRVVVKARPDKYGIFFLDLDEAAKIDPAESAARDAAIRRVAVESDLGWAVVYLGGRDGQFLVQEHVTMHYEYRVFVADHAAVTGAGCIEHHTPLDNESIFDTKVVRKRGTDEVEDRPDVVSTLLDFARVVIDEIALERPDMHSYTLDVALGDDGPLVIELNGMLNSGLYACMPTHITHALAFRASRERTSR